MFNLTVSVTHTYFVRAGWDDLWVHNGDACGGPQNGETAATKRGRQAHKEMDYGPDFEKEYELPSGRRADAVNPKTGEILELKKNNPREIRRGINQVNDYLEELNRVRPRMGSGWSGQVVTYD